MKDSSGSGRHERQQWEWKTAVGVDDMKDSSGSGRQQWEWKTAVWVEDSSGGGRQ